MRAKLFSPVLFILLLAASQVSADDGVRWQPTLEDARKLAADTHRLVLVHFWAPWCGPCMRLERDVFSQAATGQGLEARFVPVKLSADEYPARARQWGVDSLPTDVILTPDGQFVTRLKVSGSFTVDQYLANLNRVPSGAMAPATMVAQAPSGAAPGSACAWPPAATAAAAAPQWSSGPGSSIAQGNQLPASIAPQAGSAPAQASSSAWAVQNRGPAADQMAPAWASQQQCAQSPLNSAPAGQGNSIAGASAQPSSTMSAMAQKSQPGQGMAPAQAAPAAAPVALDGFCPVTLVEQQTWVPGDRRWGAIHRGRTYLFSSADRQQRFLANPDLYSPVLSGNDPVAALSRGAVIPGRREFGVFFNHRIYLFADEASLKQFSQAPHSYEAEVLQVEQPRQTVTR